MGHYTTLHTRNEEGILQITMNRPDRRNALNPQMMEELTNALLRAGKDPSCGVIILTGAGSAFCAGLDLEHLESMHAKTPEEHGIDSERMARLLRTLYDTPKPTIAAVNGAAIAGGMGLATIPDFTFSIPDAKFGYTEVKIGFLPAIVSVFLTRQIGEKRSRDLLLTGRIIDAQEARDFGMVTEVVPAENLMTRAHELTADLIAASPNSLARSKHLLTSAAAAGIDHDLERAIMENARIRCTADFKEGVASFLEKRKPVWQSKLED
jgi:methylglutaconyl-CoA hydratase